MSETVETTITIGGALPADKLPSFRAAISGEFLGALSALSVALDRGHALTLGDFRNGGTAPETERCCREFGLSFVISRDGAHPEFGADSRRWTPSMPEPLRTPNDHNGAPCMSLPELLLRLAVRRDLASVVRELKAFDPASIPPLVISVTPTETTSPPTEAMSGALAALQACVERLAYLGDAENEGWMRDARAVIARGAPSETLG